MTSQYFVHIGLPKTGTTYLQQVIFKHHPDICYLGKNSGHEEVDRAISLITRQSSATFNTEQVEKSLRQRLQTTLNRPALISDEDFSRYTFLDPELMAFRLRSAIGQFMPIYIIRNPVDWLQSMYFFRLENFHPDAMRGGDFWLEKNINNLKVGSDTGDLYYGRVAATFKKISGSDKITIMCYEELKRDKNEYIRKFSELIGINPEKTIELSNSAKNDRRRDKKRLTDVQARFILGCSSLRFNDFSSFFKNIENSLTLFPSHDLTNTEVNTALSSGKKDFESWLPIMKRILRRLEVVPSDSARLTLTPELIASLKNLCRRQVRTLSDFPLNSCREFSYF
jgi:hypothetical protein